MLARGGETNGMDVVRGPGFLFDGQPLTYTVTHTHTPLYATRWVDRSNGYIYLPGFWFGQ